MRRSLPLICGAAITAFLMLASSTPLSAQKNQPPTISAASSDQSLTTLFISGGNFASNVQVYVSGVPLTGILIGNAGSTIQATLPNGILPGSYRLMVVQVNGNQSQSASFDITLGSTGAQGEAGPPGPPGPAGSEGPTGPAGPAGANGANGAIGPTGPQGANGADGAAGPFGPTGPQGANGAVGPAGSIGPTGPQGANGAVGPAGSVGPTGPQGANGAAGPAGSVGPTGPQGAMGIQGPIGPTGPAGGAGATFTWAGVINDIPPDGSVYQFAGPQAVVTTNSIQRLTAAATAVLGKSIGSGNATVRVGLCYQANAGGTVLQFAGFNYLVVDMDEGFRRAYSATVSVVPGAGTWKVGFCTFHTGSTLNNNDFVNGWVLVQ